MAARTRKRARRGCLGGLFALLLGSLASFFGACILALVLYNVVLPPVTTVMLQRCVEAAWGEGTCIASYRPVPASRISGHLRHALVAAEDGRFYQHGGIDWDAVEEALEERRRRGRIRGGSTISQQLVKNLFLTTHSTWVRKGFEVPLVYLAEAILPKERILTLYLNVIEWGDGVYGAEAAAQHHFGRSAAGLSRYQSAQLAAVVPSPRTRSPHRMGSYTSTILTRMSQMGW